MRKSKIKGCRIDGVGQTPVAESSDTLKSNPDGLVRLFEILAAGRTPDFLEMMSAISDMVAFHIDCDLGQQVPPENFFSMSQNKCRFCS